MRKIKTAVTALLASVLVTCIAIFSAGCGKAYVVGIEQGATNDGITSYTVTYSDGSTSSFSVTDGKDGENGAPGEDGKDLTAADVYARYKEETGDDISYSEFLQKYLTFNTDNTAVISECLNSVLKVYTEFIESSRTSMWQTQTDTMIYTGSAVIYEEHTDGYTYLLTNYHVVYDSKANVNANGGYLARKIYAYLYGSESSPSATSEKDENGYSVYDYGDYALECEYIGGTVENDLAVIRVKTADIKAINENARPAPRADGFTVGQTAIAIGNPEDAGISVTEGIVSVDADYITLSIDGTKRSYRSLRIDTALYSGNSGGGLFDRNGKLIGITNAGDSSDQNINYAIPLPIVEGVADNIIYHYFNPLNTEDFTVGAYKATVGITVATENSKYVYDGKTESGKICETVRVTEVNADSIAEKTGLAANDVIAALVINEKVFKVDRSFDISDALFCARVGDSLKFEYVRGGQTATTDAYVLQKSDVKKIN